MRRLSNLFLVQRLSIIQYKPKKLKSVKICLLVPSCRFIILTLSDTSKLYLDIGLGLTVELEHDEASILISRIKPLLNERINRRKMEIENIEQLKNQFEENLATLKLASDSTLL